MEEDLREYAKERLDDLLDNGDENYRIDTPKNIRTYLLEDTGDELNKKPFLVNFLSEESERELMEEETKNVISFEDDTLGLFDGDAENTEENGRAAEKSVTVALRKEEKKKGFLFWKKK